MAAARTSRSGSKASKRKTSAQKQNDWKQKKGKSEGSLASFWQFCIIPIAVLAVSFALFKRANSGADPHVSEMVRLACSNTEDVYCSPSLVPSRRTFKTTRYIQPGETLFKIPQRLQVSDLDAVRDPFIKKELLSARISSDRNPLDSKSFLAVYIARLLKHRPEGLDPVLSAYLDTLATNYVYENHPVFWSDKELKEDLGSYTLAYDFVTVSRHRDEYDAFCEASEKFAKDITYDEYLAARVTVGSRTFSSQFIFGDEPRAEQREIAFYLEKAGVDLRRGSILIPIIDIFDHHPKAQLKVKGESSQNNVVVVRSTGDGIPAGSEVFFSYGMNPENYLFALYGFTTGDGSHPTYASLELWHKAYRSGNGDYRRVLRSQYKTQIYKYLLYDDGYVNCVNSEQGDAWSLKIAKYQSLVQIARDEKMWCVYASPRNPDLKPAMASNLPTTLKVPTFQTLDDLTVMEDFFYGTCRLISLTEHDYDGTALKLLQANMKNESYVPPATEQQDALTYRTLHCVKRMAITALERFGVSVQEQVDLVARLNREAFQTRPWIIAHVKLGEMQTLQLLNDRAVAKLQAFGSVPGSDPLYFIRQEPCSLDFVEPLAEFFS